MKVAIFVDCNSLLIAKVYKSDRLILKIHTDTSVLCLDIDECDMVLRKHRVMYTSDLNLDGLVINPCHEWNMLLETCIHCTRDKLFHLLTTAYNWDFRVHYLLYYIAAMCAFIKSCCHISVFLFCF